MSRKALIVIDAQRAFFDGDILPPVYRSADILERIAALLARARSKATPVIHVQHAGGEGHPLKPGSRGWEFHTETSPLAKEPVIGKTTPDAFFRTDLESTLRRNGIEQLVLAGNQTEFCVDTTCRRSRSLGFQVTLVSDAHSTWDNDVLEAQQIIDHHNYILGRQFAALSTADEVDFFEA